MKNILNIFRKKYKCFNCRYETCNPIKTSAVFGHDTHLCIKCGGNMGKLKRKIKR